MGVVFAVVLPHIAVFLVHIAMFLVQVADLLFQLPVSVRLFQVLHHSLFDGCGHLRIGFHLLQNGLKVWVILQILQFLEDILPMVLNHLLAVLPHFFLVVLRIAMILRHFPAVLVKLLVVLVVFPAVLAHLPPHPTFTLRFALTPAGRFFLVAARASSPHGSR